MGSNDDANNILKTSVCRGTRRLCKMDLLNKTKDKHLCCLTELPRETASEPAQVCTNTV